MWDVFSKIVSKGIPTILCVVACLVLLGAFVNYSKEKDTSKITIQGSPEKAPFALGTALLVVSIWLYWYEHLSGSWFSRKKVIKTPTGYEVCFGDRDPPSKILVSFGRIDDWQIPQTDGAIAFPVNEYFDRECFGDPNTSLGAFAKKHFPGDQFSKLIDFQQNDLTQRNLPTTLRRKEANKNAPSYGTGVSQLLDKPLNKNFRIVLVSSSTKREKVGIRCEVPFIFRAIDSIHHTMVDFQIDTLILPLLGPGKGGLRPEVSLFSMILGFSEIMRGSSGHHLKSIEIIVFQSNSSAKPEISKQRVRRILGTASAMFG